jgi:bifunctional DNA-binding transcriptional regulator/antitoxin component of YhaV-PrlF toxin-antitoxin module
MVEFPCFLVSLNEVFMLAKKTIKNQITLPKTVVTRFAGVEYFDVSTDGQSIILRPLQKSRADEVRTRLAQLGIEEEDVTAAVSWARKTA